MLTSTSTWTPAACNSSKISRGASARARSETMTRAATLCRPPNSCGEARELVGAARDEHEVVAVGREQPRDLFADAAGSARDERGQLPLSFTHPVK